MRSRSNWNLEVLVFKERGKPEYQEKNLAQQRRESTANGIDAEIRTQATLVEGDCSNHCAILAPQMESRMLWRGDVLTPFLLILQMLFL